MNRGWSFLADDGVRLMPMGFQDWRQSHEEFCETLERVGLRYTIISSSMRSIEERVSLVWSEWHGARYQDDTDV